MHNDKKTESKPAGKSEERDHFQNHPLFSDGTPDERIQHFLNLSTVLNKEEGQKTWMAALLPHITFVSTSTAGPYPRASFRFVPQPSHSNGLNNLQGGAAATVFDWCTSVALALINRPGHWFFLGVSRTLTVNYLRPVAEDEPVLIECDVVQHGRTLALISGTMRRESDGVVLCTCEHSKVNTDPPVSKESKM